MASKRIGIPVISVLAAALAAAVPGRAQLKAVGCADLRPEDFETVELFNREGTAGAAADPELIEPTRMDVQVVRNASGISHVNVYFVERLGKVKFYDGAAKKVSLMGTIDTWGKQDNGLMGVALDPGFAANRLIYLWYSPNQLVGQNRKLRLTRMTVKPDNTLDKASEKILIEILASKTDTWHSGGPMQFDRHGDLWIAIGNNSSDLDPGACNVMSKTDSTSSAEWGPSSTANMRGGFIRIHPDDSQKGYSIPRGNFGEYWADQFEKQGRTALAAEYRDPKKVLPEVYVKGERSNYSISVHPTKRWLAWGTVNYASSNDEFNITRTPMFAGFPYFHANNAKTCPSHTIDAATPRNTSPFNSGVQDLPPAVPGTLNNLVNVAIGGPIYAFDSSLDSKVKFPKHFDDSWLLTGFGGGMWAAKLDTTTLKISGSPIKIDGTLLPRARNHVQSMYGADGALYVLNYDGYYNSAKNPGAMRITYKGACAPVSVGRPAAMAPGYQKIWLAAGGLQVGEEGSHTVSLHSLSGRELRRVEGRGPAFYPLQDWSVKLGLDRGVYLVRAATGQGVFTRTVSLP